MNAQKIVDSLLNEIAPPPPSTFKAWLMPRDHREDPDESASRKMLRKIPGSHEFEFGNNVIDEYVTVVTDCPWLEEKITESLENEDVGHSLAAGDDEIVTFSTWEELVKKSEEYMGALEGDGDDEEEQT